MINDKVYIGQTVSPKNRWRSHKFAGSNPAAQQFAIHKAMQKYGIQYFTFEIIDFAFSQPQADCMENNLIQLHNSVSPGGYNIEKEARPRLGTRIVSPETRKKQSESRKRLFASGYVSYNKGLFGIIKQSDECKKKHSLNSRGRKQSLVQRQEKSQRCRKLTDAQVKAIKIDTRASRVIAVEYNITKSTVLRIKHNNLFYLRFV
jgi:group I intron endonuclease